MRNTGVGSALTVIATMAVAALGFFYAFGSNTPVDSKIMVRLAINPWPGYELLYLAQHLGFYEKEGLNVQLVEFSTLEDARRSYELGQVDGMATTLVDIVQVYHDTGEQPQVVLVTDYSNGADVILARSPKIRSAADLRGKRIAVEQMFARFVLQSALEKHGVHLADVTLVEQNLLNANDGLRIGSVDAIVTYPPMSIDALKLPGVHRVFDSSQTPGVISDVVALRRNVLAANPGFEKRLRAVWKRSIEWYTLNRKEAVDVMARREGISPKEFESALEGIQILQPSQMNAMLAPNGALSLSVQRISEFDGWNSNVEGKRPNAELFFPRTISLGTKE